MEESLQEQFFAKLEQKYGPRDLLRSRFGSYPFGAISEQLSISASQFSKLISGTATEGMYLRTINNIDRLIQRESLSQQLEESQLKLAQHQAALEQLKKKAISKKQVLSGLVIALAVSLFMLVFSLISDLSLTSPSQQVTDHPLSSFFDRDFNTSFNSPYLDVREVQQFCPGSAYEGTWSLANPYKLPIPSKNPGVYYLGRSADVRMKCSRSDLHTDEQGKVLLGYEYLVNEIWVDTRMRPVSPTFFNKETKQFTEAFAELNFEESPHFKKVATIYSFFIDRFELRGDSIFRYGEPCGRYASDVDDDLATEFEIDINYILEDVLSDMTTTRCQATLNPYCDPNALTESQSVIRFDCLYTIGNENLGIGGGYPYQKGYRLEKQNYSDNLTCTCLSVAP